jgi:hypothetical protein
MVYRIGQIESNLHRPAFRNRLMEFVAPRAALA